MEGRQRIVICVLVSAFLVQFAVTQASPYSDVISNNNNNSTENKNNSSNTTSSSDSSTGGNVEIGPVEINAVNKSNSLVEGNEEKGKEKPDSSKSQTEDKPKAENKEDTANNGAGLKQVEAEKAGDENLLKPNEQPKELIQSKPDDPIKVELEQKQNETKADLVPLQKENEQMVSVQSKQNDSVIATKLEQAQGEEDKLIKNDEKVPKQGEPSSESESPKSNDQIKVEGTTTSSNSTIKPSTASLSTTTTSPDVKETDLTNRIKTLEGQLETLQVLTIFMIVIISIFVSFKLLILVADYKRWNIPLPKFV